MMRALVTGYRGFIGGHLVQQLQKRQVNIRLVENLELLGDPSWLAKNSFTNQGYYVFHLAGKTGVVESWESFSTFFDSNVRCSQRVLEFCRLTNSQMIYLSSACYADRGSANLRPSAEDDELSLDNPYALTKSMAEQLCQFYAKHYSVRVVVLRPFNVYGPGQSRKFLIPKLIREFGTGDKIVVENLDTTRDYIHVNDLVDAIVSCSHREFRGEVFNVGTGIHHSVRQVLQIMREITGVQIDIVDRSVTRKNQIAHSVADIEKIQVCLKWSPAISLKRGLISLWQDELSRRQRNTRL
jgi:GDP-4-dehydro-6-deoxy-D-mannose reductase